MDQHEFSFSISSHTSTRKFLIPLFTFNNAAILSDRYTDTFNKFMIDFFLIFSRNHLSSNIIVEFGGFY